MNLLKHVTFSRKFAILGLTLLISAVVAIISIFLALSTVAANSDRGWQRIAAAAYVTEASKARDGVAILVSTTLAESADSSSPTAKTSPLKQLQELAQQFQTNLQSAENTLTGVDRDHFAEARTKLQPAFEAYIQTATDLLTLVQQGQLETALTEQQRLTGSFIQVGALMLTLNEALSTEAVTLQQQAHAEIFSTQKAVLVGAVAGSGIVLLVLYFITCSITVPMEVLTKAARRIATGDIDQQVTYTAGDEIGTLEGVMHFRVAEKFSSPFQLLA